MNHPLIATLGFVLLSQASAWAGEDGMTQMPKIRPKHIITVQGQEGEKLQDQRGFGDDEPAVGMMNQMMVEGSGMEGMDMGSMKPKAGTKTSGAIPYELEIENESTPARVGTNRLTLTIRNSKDRSPAKGLKLKAQVSMTSMDMGSEEPAVREVSPGKYTLKAPFAMKGPWAVKLIFPSGVEKILNFDVGSSSH